MTTAIENGVRALTATQGRNGGCNDGGWNYRTPSANADLSTTQFAAAGLAAATALDEDAGAALDLLPNMLDQNQKPDGGHIYQSCGRYESSHAMTASGVWCYRISGRDASDDQVQNALRWLRDNYQYERQTNWWQHSFYYYLWAAAKGLTVSAGDAAADPDDVFSGDIGGTRDPGSDGFPEEPASWYYDFAHLLTSEQSANGSWPTNRPNGSGGQDIVADTGFACLVLERSLGGVCLDLDEDGLCAMEDNCRELFNPDQQDSDFDGVGDACDNCWLDPNIGQEDVDLDGEGDACDKYPCVVTNGGVEICDDVDNDCNRKIDDIGVLGEICATGHSGVCAMGRMACVAGEVLCQSVHGGSRQEVCDLLDNDCDGLIDEDLRNACGRCGVQADVEACNGLDDDCDGTVDNGAACEGTRACILGECAAPCDAGQCPDDLVCADGYCVSPCAGVQCDAGTVCAPASGDCVDLCDGVTCEAREVCVDGQCGACFEIGCPAGLMCDDGQCVGDPCLDVDCARGEICKLGECVDSCSTLSCPLRQTCLDGRCVPDPCGGVACFDGQACANGECAADPCADGGDDDCSALGQLCHPELDCIADPCVGVTCGANERCEAICPDGQVDSCDARCVGDWLPGGPPPEQDFCDPDSPVFDAELCQAGRDGPVVVDGEREEDEDEDECGEGESPGEVERPGGEGESGQGEERVGEGELERVTDPGPGCECAASMGSTVRGPTPLTRLLSRMARR